MTPGELTAVPTSLEDRCRVSGVDWGRRPRRGPLFRRAPLFQLPQGGAPASRGRRLDAVVEHSVRGVARARPDVAIAGRRDVSQWSGRRPSLCDLLANLHLHLEHEVDLDRVVEIRRTSAAAECRSRMRSSRRCRCWGGSGALNVLLAACSLTAYFWQIAHPPQRLIDAFAEKPQVPPDWNLDSHPRLPDF